jgi:hypothetical protein
MSLPTVEVEQTLQQDLMTTNISSLVSILVLNLQIGFVLKENTRMVKSFVKFLVLSKVSTIQIAIFNTTSMLRLTDNSLQENLLYLDFMISDLNALSQDMPHLKVAPQSLSMVKEFTIQQSSVLNSHVMEVKEKLQLIGTKSKDA